MWGREGLEVVCWFGVGCVVSLVLGIFCSILVFVNIGEKRRERRIRWFSLGWNGKFSLSGNG